MTEFIAKLIGAAVLTTALGSAGCLVGPAPVRVSAHATVPVAATPNLVTISPGVYVVEDYGEPVFYNEGYYWLYRDGYWFQSSVYTGGWVRVRTTYVPVGVRRIDRPRRYVRYRARPGVHVHRGPPAGTRVRDHRTHRPAPATRVRDHRTPRTAPAPRVRDHRAPRPAPGSRVRDHRTQPRPAPAPRAKDHRNPPKVKDHRRKDDDGRVKDHRNR